MVESTSSGVTQQTAAATPPSGAAVSAPSAPPSTPAPQYTPDSDVHLLDRLAVLYRYRRICVTTFVLVLNWWVESDSSLSPRQADDLFVALVVPTLEAQAGR